MSMYGIDMFRGRGGEPSIRNTSFVIDPRRDVRENVDVVSFTARQEPRKRLVASCEFFSPKHRWLLLVVQTGIATRNKKKLLF